MGAVLNVAVNKRAIRLKEIDAERAIAEKAIKDAHAMKREADRELVRSTNEVLRLKHERIKILAAIAKEEAMMLERAQNPNAPIKIEPVSLPKGT